jgi:hypothetical protein
MKRVGDLRSRRLDLVTDCVEGWLGGEMMRFVVGQMIVVLVLVIVSFVDDGIGVPSNSIEMEIARCWG